MSWFLMYFFYFILFSCKTIYQFYGW
jgi:hypothetical protein